MTLEEALIMLQQGGFTIAVKDGQPRLLGPATNRTPELLAACAEHREALIELYSPVPPRRVVLLADGRDSEVERQLEQIPACAGLKRARELAQLHRGRTLALEWLSTTGWIRYTWLNYPAEGKHEPIPAVA